MKSGADSRSRWEQILNINNPDIRQTRKRWKEKRRSNGATGTSTGSSPKATTSFCDRHPSEASTLPARPLFQINRSIQVTLLKKLFECHRFDVPPFARRVGR